MVRQVVDGDTLLLADGEKVRLIGINAPELARKQRAPEAYSKRAKARLKALVESSNSKLYLQYGSETQDRYRRSLAHIYDRDGRNLIERLLEEGLGFAIVFPPNLEHIDCYQRAEQRAQERKEGIWSEWPIVRAVDLPLDAGGFHLLQGVIKRVGKSRRSLWLNLEGGVALRIDWQDMSWFPALQVDRLVGQKLLARGWIYHRKGERRIRLRHQAAIRWLP